MNISPFLSTSHPCDEALKWANKQLRSAGLRSVQTFDLQAARAALPECSCPNHGTDECDCQMIVLLVYGNAEEPVTLILHGNDGKTWFSVTDNPQQRSDKNLCKEIHQALEKESVSFGPGAKKIVPESRASDCADTDAAKFADAN
jgi:hypothetical protein